MNVSAEDTDLGGGGGSFLSAGGGTNPGSLEPSPADNTVPAHNVAASTGRIGPFFFFIVLQCLSLCNIQGLGVPGKSPRSGQFFSSSAVHVPNKQNFRAPVVMPCGGGSLCNPNRCSPFFINDRIGQLTDFFDLDRDGIPVFQEDLRVACGAYPLRRPG